MMQIAVDGRKCSQTCLMCFELKRLDLYFPQNRIITGGVGMTLAQPNPTSKVLEERKNSNNTCSNKVQLYCETNVFRHVSFWLYSFTFWETGTIKSMPK